MKFYISIRFKVRGLDGISTSVQNLIILFGGFVEYMSLFNNIALIEIAHGRLSLTDSPSNIPNVLKSTFR